MILTAIALLILNTKVYLLESTVYLSNITISCRELLIYPTKKDFELKIGEKKFSLSVEGTSIYSKEVSGYFFDRYFEAQKFELSPERVKIYNLCISLCELNCPKNGIFGNLDVQREYIHIQNPKVKILNTEIPLFFISEKTDSYGRSPGFTNPSFSVSRNNKLITGVDFYFPFPSIDFSLSTLYFQRDKIFLGGLYGKTLNENFSFDVRYANPEIILVKHNLNLQNQNYQLFSFGNIFTEAFLERIPARVEISSAPFGIFQQEGRLNTENLQIENYTYTFSNFLTGFENFSRILLTYGKRSFFSIGGIGNFSQNPKRVNTLLPTAKFFFQLDQFGLSGKIVPFGSKIYVKDSQFLPYEAYFYILSEDFLYPFLFSLSYSDFYDLYFLSSQGYTALNVLSSDFPPKDISLIPEAGFSLISGGFNFFGSFGIKQTKNSEIFSDSGIIWSLDLITFELRNTTYKNRFMTRISLLQSFLFGSRNLRNEISVFISNSAPFFRQEIQNKKTEVFPSYRSEILLSPLRFQFGMLFYQIKPVQISSLISYNIRRICSEIFIEGIYNFTDVGEPRLSFGLRVNL